MSKRRYPINPEEWIHHLSEVRGAAVVEPLKVAVDLFEDKNQVELEKGLGIADILLSLGLDNETLASAILYPLLQANEIHIDSVAEYFGESSVKLLQDVLQMRSLGKLQQFQLKGSLQIENLRKMLLAMVTDVRAVLIVLAERLWELRDAKRTDPNEQKVLADETLSVYAPLANRLGIWQLKWEIEDLCLRYSHPEIYMQIAKGIASRRDDREAYIQRMVTILNDAVEQSGIRDFQIKGRAKHIYSIYKKMQRKNANLEQIYDMSAIRILVQTVEDCYAVLGVLQNGWQQLPEEFDDYITHPKPNGYRSIHTVLLGPENHFVEVQIRTFQMHQESELGVAAHWRYKEGVLQTSSYESKIALLRQIIEWQKELVSENQVKEEQPVKDLFADRIYVFTPIGDIIDLPKGATPLDFAYLIHSEVGHRCRGAKVDGNIVPLTYELQMGQRVEILTAKLANPSRDWLNPQHGYLKSPRARAKVQHWFRLKDSMKNAVSGRELLDKELRRLGVSNKISLNKVAARLNYKTDDELLAALASGEIRMAQVIHLLLPADHVENVPVIESRESNELAPNIHILGMNNLLTHIARCCKPLPGDAVVGYVTRNRGVSIHRRDCSNMENLAGEGRERLMDVNWGDRQTGAYPADLLIRVYDRAGLLRDITTMLASEKINVLGLQTQKISDSPEVDIYLTIQIANRQQLKSALEMIQKLPNIIEVRRR